MDDRDPLLRAALGAAAGVVGTLVLQPIRAQTAKALPETVPPMREEPGVFVVEQAEELLPDDTREQIPEGAEQAAAKSLALAYGATAGALYGALLADDRNALVDGAVLGIGTWAIGYLGWLPAFDQLLTGSCGIIHARAHVPYQSSKALRVGVKREVGVA